MPASDHTAGSTSADDVLLPDGFRYSGVACGIKKSGKADLSLIVADRPVVAAGVYTQNQIVAAPVVLCRQRTPSPRIRAVVTNSGNANACTGSQGMQDAQTMCQMVAGKLDCDEQQVLVMSTGVIGQKLPMDRVSDGIMAAYGELSDQPQAFGNCADAIRTTDVDRKTAFKSLAIGNRHYRLAAMAKGAGMIAPNMATMLAVVLTDAPLAPEQAQQLLKTAADQSFNRVSVDGHTSTNDTLLLLSSGEGAPLDANELASFQQALNEVSIRLARMLVADGEGAQHVMALRVSGAADERAATVIARTVAASPLVKTAITGGDPNWGRIVSAAGYAEATLDPERVSLKICGTTIYKDGAPVDFDAAELSRQMKAEKEVPIELSVGNGPGNADYWSSDLTVEYVRFNSEYTT